LEETPKHLARRDSGAPPRMESIQIYSLERFTERCVCLFCSPHGNDKIFRTQGAHLRFARLVKVSRTLHHRELFELPFPVPETQSAFHLPFFRAIRRIALATHCQSFHLHSITSGPSASSTCISPNSATSCLSWRSTSLVIGARSSGGIFCLGRLRRFEPLTRRGELNRLAQV
jgi:hypothetical protein